VARLIADGEWWQAAACRSRQVQGIWGGLTEQERHHATKTSQGT